MRTEKHIIEENYWEVAVQKDNMWKGVSTHNARAKAVAAALELEKEDNKVTLWEVFSKLRREMVPYQ